MPRYASFTHENLAVMKNILGSELEACCFDPLTGYRRDGYCRTQKDDQGRHLICAEISAEFLEFTLAQGNDLITPHPEYQFPGLKPGDHWCLCITRWLEAERAGVAPRIFPKSCHLKVLEYVDISLLSVYFVNN